MGEGRMRLDPKLFSKERVGVEVLRVLLALGIAAALFFIASWTGGRP